MKGRFVAFVGVFCIAILIVSVADAGKPVRPPGHPGGGQDKTRAECIVFVDNQNDQNDSGDDLHVYLEGGQGCAIEGCCPNAGPWPLYMMTLNNVCYESPYEPEGTEGKCLQVEEPFLGLLFMNVYGRNAPYDGWKVQFWTCDYRSGRRPHYGDFFFQIRGGTEVPQGKKSKVSVIEFLDANDATLWVYYDENLECDFPSETGCEPCLNEMVTGCDPWADPEECLYPCWIEQPLDNVSFVIVRTADLTYTSPEEELGIDCPDITCTYP